MSHTTRATWPGSSCTTSSSSCTPSSSSSAFCTPASLHRSTSSNGSASGSSIPPMPPSMPGPGFGPSVSPFDAASSRSCTCPRSSGRSGTPSSSCSGSESSPSSPGYTRSMHCTSQLQRSSTCPHGLVLDAYGWYRSGSRRPPLPYFRCLCTCGKNAAVSWTRTSGRHTSSWGSLTKSTCSGSTSALPARRCFTTLHGATARGHPLGWWRSAQPGRLHVCCVLTAWYATVSYSVLNPNRHIFTGPWLSAFFQHVFMHLRMWLRTKHRRASQAKHSAQRRASSSGDSGAASTAAVPSGSVR